MPRALLFEVVVATAAALEEETLDRFDASSGPPPGDLKFSTSSHRSYSVTLSVVRYICILRCELLNLVRQLLGGFSAIALVFTFRHSLRHKWST